MELNERKQRILSAVIDIFIRTGEPVGSKALVGLLDNSVSSATIRNEMAELAAMGYLEQPHTSAGRIPTAIAFRLYIDKLMKRNELSEQDRRGIDGMLTHAADDPEKLIGTASQALAEETGCIAVTTTPTGKTADIRMIDVLRISSLSAALLLMSGSGLLRTKVCRFDRVISDNTLEMLSQQLNQNFCGCSLSDIGLPQIQGMVVSLGEHGLLCAPALNAFYQLVQESAEAEVLLTGQLNLLRHPDYEPERARDLLSFLAHRELLSGLLTAMPNGLRVVIGSESQRPELDGSSIIVTRYKLGGGPDGSIGIIGPLRMNYATEIPRIEYFAWSIGKILDEIMGENNGRIINEE
ncbi:MAG: heat-inducible transcriptional repressor HrcA [Oscillospiraceae bacterium]|nr:heat-inducible transcriptional repressor HrcA [Oscillospiraceae bacterium]MDD4413741.1 heat-inducible transcriptional repressor HrcA [Oscillospiraceae bacterium]